MRLGGGEEDVDLVEASSPPLEHRERRVKPTLIGNQHRDLDLGGDVAAREHLGRVGELGDHVGAHEARHLQPPQTGTGERVDQLDLALGGDHLGLVLKAVAGAHLPDAHPARKATLGRAHGRCWGSGLIL